MFGANNQNINQYKKISIETGVEAANPVELIVMLYQGAIVACYSAIPYVQKNDYPNKSQFIFKAIRIIQSGLRMSLNKHEGGEIAETLDALYIYMTNLLIKANIDNTTAPIQEVINLLTELRGAWEAISKTDAANINKQLSQASHNNNLYLEKV
ncbi:MAG: flagellar export chaperone FliS [Methylophilaceae bacterium]